MPAFSGEVSDECGQQRLIDIPPRKVLRPKKKVLRPKKIDGRRITVVADDGSMTSSKDYRIRADQGQSPRRPN